MIRFISIVVLASLFVAAPVSSPADDFNPPNWRGSPLTVQAEWEFETSNLLDVVPYYINTVGDGVHELGTAWTHTHPQDAYWEPDPGEPGDGRLYTGAIPGRTDCFLVNWIDDYPFKYIWVQITYGGQGVPSVYEVVAPNQLTNGWEDPVYGTVHNTFAWGPGQWLEVWILPYNPDREYVNIFIPPFTWIDQIMIDTISSPGPVSVEETSWGGIKSLYR